MINGLVKRISVTPPEKWDLYACIIFYLTMNILKTTLYLSIKVQETLRAINIVKSSERCDGTINAHWMRA